LAPAAFTAIGRLTGNFRLRSREAGGSCRRPPLVNLG